MMGLYDTVNAWFKCPYCGVGKWRDFQTKDLSCEMNTYYASRACPDGENLSKQDTTSGYYIPVQCNNLMYINAYTDCDSPQCKLQAICKAIMARAYVGSMGRWIDVEFNIQYQTLPLMDENGPLRDHSERRGRILSEPSIAPPGLAEEDLGLYADACRSLDRAVMQDLEGFADDHTYGNIGVAMLMYNWDRIYHPKLRSEAADNKEVALKKKAGYNWGSQMKTHRKRLDETKVSDQNPPRLHPKLKY